MGFDGDFETDLGLKFEAEYEIFDEKLKAPLIVIRINQPNGHLINVTKDNREDYVLKYSDWYLSSSIELQFKAFRKGFYKVVNGEFIKVFLF